MTLKSRMSSGNPVETPAGRPSEMYACKCLNIQIISSTQAPASSPDGTRDPAYDLIFVDDEGIAITHPQVTVRTTTHAEPIPGTSRYSRFIVLTCLLCRLPAYRVFQTISLDIQSNENILLPTDDWVERDILKSSTGWIQIHKDGIVGDSISQAKASPSYSRTFSLLLPAEPLSLSPSLSPNMNTEPSPSNSAELLTCLPAVRPLFFPPPFTPSHPIFVHLASIANEESQNLRGAAEQRIADFVKAETAAIEAREQSLRHQVEVFWTTYRDHLNALQGEPSKQSLNVTRSYVSHCGPGVLGVVISNSSVSIRNFDPVPISPLLSPPSSGPRTSALSASLATSTFHLDTNTNEASTHSSAYSGSATPSTTYSKSPTLIPDAVQVANNNVLQYKRNVNDDINTQASYRYFINLEEDMARYKLSQEVALKGQQEAETGKLARQQIPTQAGFSSFNSNGNLKHVTVQATKFQSTTEDGCANHEEIVSPREREKGKRKLSFDVEPAVMTTKMEADGKVEEDVTTDQESGDMLFSLEDMEGGDTGDSSDIQLSTLPLLEQVVSRPLRPKTIRPQTNIEIFSSLRPSSLPNPSHIRPMRSQLHVDSSSHSMLPRPKVLIASNPGGSRSPPPHHRPSPQIPTGHDAELLRLVAADTPSHRGAWAPNSRAWLTFIRRQDLKEDVDRNGRILEEGEETEETDSDEGRSPVITRDQLADDDYNGVSQPISSSVPITIIMRNQPPETEPLNLSSYRSKTNSRPNQPLSSNGDVPSLPHGRKMPSSTSIRKAKYAERDRARAMDPGTLDFATIVEEDEGETLTNQMISGERSRKLALKILKARNELPENGTWRSVV